MKNLTKEEWKTLVPNDENAIILDVRTPAECAEGIIPNAQTLDFFEPNKFAAVLGNMDKEKNFYVYCRSGGRSVQACQLMKQLGVDNTYNLLGGMMDWDGEVVK